jgi:hypothetical protein
LQAAHCFACSMPCDASLQQLEKVLVETGQLFTGSLPLKSLCCNNPMCANVGGTSEAEAASRQCGACRAASYCSSVCQKHHWQQHRQVCSAGVGCQQRPR